MCHLATTYNSSAAAGGPYAISHLTLDANAQLPTEQHISYTVFDKVARISNRHGGAKGSIYDQQLGRFLSPDPYVQMPDYSQNFNRYSYCLNNPLKYVDPSGEWLNTIYGYDNMFFDLDDWFQNEETGEIYYNNKMRKGDETQLGKNWIFLGENGMFYDGTPMSSDVFLLAQSKSLTNLEPNDDGSISIEGYLQADKAERFMNKQGYDLVPTQQTIYENESSSYFPTSPGKGITIITGAETRITEKAAYIKSGNMEVSKHNLLEIMSNTNVLALEKISRYQINYTDNAWKKFTSRTINISKALSGTHDYRMKRTYKNWNQYPRNNRLINQFKVKYGTK